MPEAISGLAEHPLALMPHRVKRYYRGGRMIDRFQAFPDPSDESGSDECVASTISIRALPEGASPPAIQGASTDASRDTADTGLTRVILPDGHSLTLREMIDLAPEDMLGEEHVRRLGHSMGLLVKLLDLANGIPVHVHPPQEFARRYLNSSFGKNEAWIVLGTRPSPSGKPSGVWLGLKEGVTCDEFHRWVRLQDSEAMYNALHRIDLSEGDVLFVPAGLPHALEAGLFVMEPQEPTAFALVAEYARYHLDPADVRLGLDWDVALDCIDYTSYNREALLNRCQCKPQRIRSEPGGRIWNLLRPEADTFFGAQRIIVDDQLQFPAHTGFAVDLVLCGRGTLEGAFGALQVAQGRALFLPASLKAYHYQQVGNQPLEIIRCLPPLLL